MQKHDKHHMQSNNNNSDMIWPISHSSFDLHLGAPWSSCHQLDTLISIVASLSSRQLLLLQLSLPFSDKVKQLHGDCISYNKATTIRLLPVADKFYKTWSSHTTTYINHVLTISHHNMPCKNKLDVIYFVVASFTWLLRASSKNRSYLCIKNRNDFSSSVLF